MRLSSNDPESRSSLNRCLSAVELADYVAGGAIVQEKVLHLAGCAMCQSIVKKTKCPPDMSAFIRKMTSRENLQGTKIPDSIFTMKSRRLAFAAAGSIILLLGVVVGGAATFAVAKQEVSKTVQEKSVLETKLFVLSQKHLYEKAALDAEIENQPIEQWPTATIVAWMVSDRNRVNQEMARLFFQSRKRRIVEAIPRAILFAKMKSENNRTHVDLARAYLNDFSDEDIETHVKNLTPLMGKNAGRLMSKFWKFHSRIRGN